MKKCIYCGQMIPDEAGYCPGCGGKQPDLPPIKQSNQVPSQQPVPMPSQQTVPVPSQQSAPMPSQQPAQAPSPAPAWQQPIPAPVQQPKKSGSKTPMIVLIIVLVCVLTGAAGYAAYSFTQRKPDTDNVQVPETTKEDESEEVVEEEHEDTTVDMSEDSQETTFETTQPQEYPVNWAKDYSFSVAQATSTLSPEANIHYEAALVQDGNLSTTWSEGVAGDGIGEYIILSTYDGKSREVGQLVIYGGYHKSSELYIKNGAPTSVEIQLDDGYKENVYLNYDNAHVATVDLGGLHPTSNIKITITGVRTGSSYQDTCISEVEVMTDGVDAVATPMAGGTAIQQPVATSAYQVEGDYILPDSSLRMLTDAELNGLTPEQLKLARNEIYARHGRLFNDATIQAYFSSKSWYSGTISPNSFSEDMLSEIEKYNRDLIKKHESN